MVKDKKDLKDKDLNEIMENIQPREVLEDGIHDDDNFRLLFC